MRGAGRRILEPYSAYGERIRRDPKRSRWRDSGRTLDFAVLAHHHFVLCDRPMRQLLSQLERGSVVRDTVAYLMRVPCVLEAAEARRVDSLQLLPHRASRVPELRQEIVEHDVGLDDGLAPVALVRPLYHLADMRPAAMVALGLCMSRMDRRVARLLFAPHLMEADGRVHEHDEQAYGRDKGQRRDEEPQLRGELQEIGLYAESSRVRDELVEEPEEILDVEEIYGRSLRALHS